MAKNATREMTSGSPVKLILSFAVPLLLGMLFQQFYSMVDTIIVGKSLGVENRHSRPCVRWLASWLWMLIPTCTMPQPRMMMPMALMIEKMKSDRLLTMLSGSLAVA